jgi:hypothetical protein
MRSLIRGLGLAFLFPTMAAAQQIRGVVVEDSTFRPISDARVEVIAADGTIRATSMSAVLTGWFTLNAQSGETLLVRATHPNYSVSGTLNVIVGPREALTVVLRLSGGPIPIDALIVQASRGRLAGYDERVRRGAFGHFITRADIDKRGGYSLSHMLRFTPEVRIERVRDGPFTSDGVFMRSFGDLCVPSIFLDGMPVPNSSAFDIDALLSLEAVEGIEVYRSALSAPMEFRLPGSGSDGLCGVVAVWSRPLANAPLTIKRVLFAGMLIGASMLFTRVIQ